MIYLYVKILPAQEISHHPPQLPPIFFHFFLQIVQLFKSVDKISEYVAALNGVVTWAVSISQEGKDEFMEHAHYQICVTQRLMFWIFLRCFLMVKILNVSHGVIIHF